MKILIISLLFILLKCLCDVESRNYTINLLDIIQSEDDGHAVISPFGIWTLMAGLALGATGNSFKQLSNVFELPKNHSTLVREYKDLTEAVLDPATTGVNFSSKNFVFLDDDFSTYPEFRRTFQTDYDALLKFIDFNDTNTARIIANSYILHSGGNDSNILTSNDFGESKMFFANLMSFKGFWTFPFNLTETIRRPFYDEDQRIIGQVNMMFQQVPIPFSTIPKLKSVAIDLPYGNDDKYSMLILLPRDDVKIADVIKNLVNFTIEDVLMKLQEDIDDFGVGETDILIPRFQISTNVVLNKALYEIGVRDIFERDVARFDKVSKDKIFVSTIVHKVDIDVTEAGTVAPDTVTTYFANRVVAPKFNANRPFAYFVIEKTTTTVIFAGIYSKPSVY